MKPSDIFTCQKCGECCNGYGGTFVTPADIVRMAAYIRTSPGLFVEIYCKFSGGKPLLAQNPGGRCIFWKKLCTIHPVKPRMCKAWPFIKSVLIDVDNWYIMANSCPGIRTDAPAETVKACVREAISNIRTYSFSH